MIWLSNEAERELARILGINLTDYRALMALTATRLDTVGALAAHLGMSAATTTAIVTRLENRGYLERQRSTDDRRVVNLHLSPAVQQHLRTLMQPLEEQAQAQLDALPQPEQAAISSFLSCTVDALRRHIEYLAATPPTHLPAHPPHHQSRNP